MLTLPEAKLHLRVDGEDEDAYIEALVAVASEYVTRMVSRAPTAAVPVPAPTPVTETQRHAVRLLLGHWYANREAASATAVSEVPMAVSMLLAINRPAESWI